MLTPLPPGTSWTAEQLAALRERYPHEPSGMIAAYLGRPLSSVYGKAQDLGLKKTAEFFASPASGRTNGRQGIGTRFSKHSTSWNKGIKGLHYEASVKSQFKPGSKPHNTMPIGSYRIVKGVLQRKTSEAKGSNSKRWRSVHELVWIEANGPVPPKHIVVFKAGMHTNAPEEITIDKVECISLAESMRRNTRHNYPKELSDLIALRAAVNRQINKRMKSNEQ